MKKTTFLLLTVMLCTGWYTSAQCLDAYQWPEDEFTPDTCDGVTENVILEDGYAGEYSVVNVTEGETYTFVSGVTDYVTISTDEGETAAAWGPTPLTWVADVSGPVFFYSHTDEECGEEESERVRAVVCGMPTSDSPDYVSLQWPPNGTIAQGESLTVYGQVYEGGLTNVEPGLSGQAAGITAWVGVSSMNTDPATWPGSFWVPATFNPSSSGNNDEYMAGIGEDLGGGTYYYATRFRLNGGGYVYGGINSSNNGNFWNGTAYNSGILNVTPTVANDICSGAIALVPGADFESGAMTFTNLDTGANDGIVPECQDGIDQNVWFTVVVPDSGNLTLQTGTVDGSTFEDTVMAVFTGTCDALEEIDCNDDGDEDTTSYIELSGRTPGEVLYVSVWRYSGLFEDDGPGEFMLSAFDESLGADSFDHNGFSYYPNPVKNVLNLSSAAHDISNVAVFNLLGQQVMEKSDAGISQLDMSRLPAGTYLVKVTADNVLKTIKVIKS